MQSLTWYLHRLQAMSPEEVGWRLRSALRDAVEVARPPRPAPGSRGTLDGTPGFRVSDVEVGQWSSASAGTRQAQWRDRVLSAADPIAAHRLSFFNLRDRHLGDPIDWNQDHESGRRAPLGRARSIDYRDHRIAGDAKLVWEPNRHHQLVVLARAYRATGEVRYAEAAVEQWESWLEQCPFGRGMNWRSPLELAIRLINWVWAVDLLRESGLLSGEFGARLLDSAYLHLREISRNYSLGSSANNHRIGEAAGVFIGASYFSSFPEATRWKDESRDILAREALAQTYPDGGSRELALGYHLFVLEFLLFSGLVARRDGRDFAPAYWERIEKMMEFLAILAEGGERLPMFGDSDDGCVLDFGGAAGDHRSLLSIGASVFARPDFKVGAAEHAEAVRWLLGREGVTRLDALANPSEEEPLASRALPDSGFYLLQSGRRGGPESISVLFDCGDLGFGSIAAHGHADALSFTLRASGKDVFVDPGTYDYFTYPAWRDYFRSTRAHNTVVVDGADQSRMLAPFLWGARAAARCLSWAPVPAGGTVAGEHDGYGRLADPVRHRRTLELDGTTRTLTIRDEIASHGRHEVAVSFHLAEDCRVQRVEANRCEMVVAGMRVTLDLDPRLAVETVTASEAPGPGWVSREYHQKLPSTTLVGRGTCRGDTTLVCRVAMGLPREGSDGGPRRSSRSEGGDHGEQGEDTWDRTGRHLSTG